jgi:hypothetical protein
MKIGIIGRHPAVLEGALALARELGHEAVGTSADDEALRWLADRTVAALVIGGGVEPAARAKLLAACKESAVRPVEVFGPENLRAVLAALGD